MSRNHGVHQPHRSPLYQLSTVVLFVILLGSSIVPVADAKAVASRHAQALHRAAIRAVAQPASAVAAPKHGQTPVDEAGQPLPTVHQVDGVQQQGATDGFSSAALTPSAARRSRLGLDRLWTYTSQEHGGGNTSYVNVSNGNVVVQHRGGAIPALGFDVDLTHTYNSQDSYGRNKATPDAGAWYGEGWSFAMDLRLIELDGGSTVVFKDGTGMLRAYTSNGDGTYARQLSYGYTLVRTATNPADRLYTLTSDVGAIQHFFNAAGQRTRVQDRNGNFLTFGYDTSGRLTTITDRASRTTTLEYAELGGRLSRISDMADRLSVYDYDTEGNLSIATHASGTTDAATTALTYGTTGQLTRIGSPRAHESLIGYEIEHQWDTTGDVEGWATTSGPATIAHSTAQQYTGSGSIQVSVSGLSSTTGARIERSLTAPNNTFGSTPLDMVAFVYVPLGAPTIRAQMYVQHSATQESVTGTLASGQWNLLRVEAAQVDVDNPVTKLGFNFTTVSGSYTGPLYVDRLYFVSVASSVSDAKPARTKLAVFDASWSSRTMLVQRPDQGSTNRDWTYIYDANGQVTRVTDPVGNVTGGGYDTSLRLTSVTLPGGTATTYALAYYPNSNQLQTFRNELGEETRRGANTTNGDTRYTLDPLNEQRRTGAQAYEAQVYNRDASGNVTSVATNRYAAGTNLEQSTLPPPSSTLRQASYTYGAGGVIASMTDARGNVTNFSYLANTGYLTQIDAPAGAGETTRRVTTITPNADGTVQRVVDPKGQTTTYEYDGLGRLRRINYGVGATGAFSISYTLDKNGNITAMTDRAGSTSWVYDENNQPTSEARTQNATTRTASYRYFANGLLSGWTTFSSQTVSLGYDTALRLTSQTDPRDTGRAISFRYDTRGRRNRITYGSGVYQELTYDKADRIDLMTLKTSAGTIRQSFDYYYGFSSTGARQADYRKGFVVSVAEQDGTNISNVSYGYDDLDRLTSATRTGLNPFTQTYSYDGNNNRTSFVNNGTTTSATYDSANQMTSLGGVAHSYDRNGNLTGFGSNTLTYDRADDWTGGTINSQSVAFGYDGLGRRTNRSIGTARTDFWYDQTGLSLETGAASATYLRDPKGTPLSVYNGTLYNYGRDRLGSVTGLISTGGTLNTSYRYDPYGQSIGTTGTAYNALRYTGVYFDSATTFYRMTQRYYQPSAGRFTQLDPLPSTIISINRYQYASCNPANITDPTGLLDECQEAIGTLGVAVVGGIAGVLTATGVGAIVAFGLIGAAGSYIAADNVGDECR